MRVFASHSVESDISPGKHPLAPGLFPKPVAAVSVTQSGGALLQRKAACGCGGGCPTCQESVRVRAKLAVSTPGDEYEQEADRVAEKVMRMPDATIHRSGAGGSNRSTECPECKSEKERLIQGKSARVSRSSSSVSDNILNHLGPGRSLDAVTTNLMEQRFGHDFSHVRVHTNAQAAESAQSFDAQAYTVGHHIVFDQGMYRPNSHAGRLLLAHELTHVVQQRRNGGHTAGLLDHPGDAHETVANRITNAMSSGQSVTGIATGTVPAIQRQSRPRNTATGDPTDLAQFISSADDEALEELQDHLEHLMVNPPQTPATIPLEVIVPVRDGHVPLTVWSDNVRRFRDLARQRRDELRLQTAGREPFDLSRAVSRAIAQARPGVRLLLPPSAPVAAAPRPADLSAIRAAEHLNAVLRERGLLISEIHQAMENDVLRGHTDYLQRSLNTLRGFGLNGAFFAWHFDEAFRILSNGGRADQAERLIQGAERMLRTFRHEWNEIRPAVQLTGQVGQRVVQGTLVAAGIAGTLVAGPVAGAVFATALNASHRLAQEHRRVQRGEIAAIDYRLQAGLTLADLSVNLLTAGVGRVAGNLIAGAGASATSQRVGSWAADFALSQGAGTAGGVLSEEIRSRVERGRYLDDEEIAQIIRESNSWENLLWGLAADLGNRRAAASHESHRASLPPTPPRTEAVRRAIADFVLRVREESSPPPPRMTAPTSRVSTPSVELAPPPLRLQMPGETSPRMSGEPVVLTTTPPHQVADAPPPGASQMPAVTFPVPSAGTGTAPRIQPGWTSIGELAGAAVQAPRPSTPPVLEALPGRPDWLAATPPRRGHLAVVPGSTPSTRTRENPPTASEGPRNLPTPPDTEPASQPVPAIAMGHDVTQTETSPRSAPQLAIISNRPGVNGGAEREPTVASRNPRSSSAGGGPVVGTSSSSRRPGTADSELQVASSLERVGSESLQEYEARLEGASRGHRFRRNELATEAARIQREGETEADLARARSFGLQHRARDLTTEGSEAAAAEAQGRSLGLRSRARDLVAEAESATAGLVEESQQAAQSLRQTAARLEQTGRRIGDERRIAEQELQEISERNTRWQRAERVFPAAAAPRGRSNTPITGDDLDRLTVRQLNVLRQGLTAGRSDIRGLRRDVDAAIGRIQRHRSTRRRLQQGTSGGQTNQELLATIRTGNGDVWANSLAQAREVANVIENELQRTRALEVAEGSQTQGALAESTFRVHGPESHQAATSDAPDAPHINVIVRANETWTNVHIYYPDPTYEGQRYPAQ